MTMDERTLASVEQLRIPTNDELAPLDWKDWYHFILMEPKSGVRVLVNLTLSGRLTGGELQLSFIATIPKEFLSAELHQENNLATFGTAYPQRWVAGTVSREPLRLQGQNVSLEIDGRNSQVAVRDEESGLAIAFTASAEATPLLVTEESPFGSGFIGWGLVPGLQVAGELSVGDTKFPIRQDWFCYHDRNFGRFRWGEDIGWEWFVAFATCADGRTLTLVLDRRTNRDHSEWGLSYIFVYLGNQLRKIFLGSTLAIDWEWSATGVLPIRLPGVMASVFAHRSVPMPESLRVEAADERDSLSVAVNFDSAMELVVADNRACQYSFIEEVSGNVEVKLLLDGEMLHGWGLIYAEYVV
ncbi:hypothetical protein [Okeania sp. SIO2B3]|uniref:hypothetical protein n=1 Tax=Okeania sp. SIO2B3 TaxID=2607784 RepID=UPI0013C231CA|nr:hypothetical protein [Okeania sp. SIO2B3]NET44191.1 hypothetical protein [Okeania sp. SIO2B3]